MSIENYEKVIECLDVIEAELNKIAKAVGHISFEEFASEEAVNELKIAA